MLYSAMSMHYAHVHWGQGQHYSQLRVRTYHCLPILNILLPFRSSTSSDEKEESQIKLNHFIRQLMTMAEIEPLCECTKTTQLVHGRRQVFVVQKNIAETLDSFHQYCVCKGSVHIFPHQITTGSKHVAACFYPVPHTVHVLLKKIATE